MDPGQGLCRLLAEIAEKTPVQRPFRKTVGELTALDLAYAPPFSPVWNPILVVARQAAAAVRDTR
jgi:hypothetical protein